MTLYSRMGFSQVPSKDPSEYAMELVTETK